MCTVTSVFHFWPIHSAKGEQIQIQETDTDTKTGSESSVQNQTGQGIHHQHKRNIT